MKSNKQLFLFSLFMTIVQLMSAQTDVSASKRKYVGISSPIIYLGGGASSILKTRHETAKNSISNVRLVVSTPVVSHNQWNFGIDVEGDYLLNSTANPTVSPVETPDGSTPDITYSNSGNSGGFSIGGGPFVMLPIFDKLIFKPSFELLYTSLKQKAQTAVQHYTYGDNTTDFALYSSTSKPASGLSMLPKLNLTYQFGRIGIWLEGNYLMGPKMSSTITTLEGASIDAKGRVSSEGEPVTTISDTKLNALGVSAGISIALGKPKRNGLIDKLAPGLTTDINGSGTNNPNPPTPSQAQDFNTTRSNRENRFSTNNPETNDSTSSTNSVNELKKKDSMPSRLSMTPTTARQSQGKTFGESVASGSQNGASALGGVLASGGTLNLVDKLAPGVVKNNNDSTYTNPNPPTPAEAQDFNATRSNRERGDFSTDNPETNDSTSSTNSVNELKKKDSMPSRLSVTPTNTRQSQGKTFGESVASGIQSGASAIGGKSKSGGTVSSSYAAGLQTTDNNGSSTENSNSSTTTKQIQSQNLGGAPGGNFQGVVSAAPSGINQNDGNTTSTQEKPSISLEIVSPADGSVFKTSDKIKIQVNSTEKLSGNTSIKIYKVSNDVNYWKNDSNLASSVKGNNPLYESDGNSGTNPLFDSAKNDNNNPASKPITVEYKLVDNSLTSEIKPGKLTTGAYQLMVVESDGTRVRGFTIIR